MITYHFHISNNPIAHAIRTYSKYSHVSTEFMGNVYEPIMLYKKTGKRGVIKTPVELWDNSTVVKSETLEILYPELVHAFLEEQVGKGYDYLGVLSFVWRFFSDRIGRWYCSEMSTVSLAKGRGVEEYSQKQTPESFYQLVQFVK